MDQEIQHRSCEPSTITERQEEKSVEGAMYQLLARADTRTITRCECVCVGVCVYVNWERGWPLWPPLDSPLMFKERMRQQ